MVAVEDKPGPFSVHYAACGDRMVVTVTGELDSATAPQLRATGLEASRRAKAELGVDVRGVSFIDSQGLAALLAIFKDATGRAVRFSVLCGPGETAPYRLLRLVRLDDALGVHRDER